MSEKNETFNEAEQSQDKNQERKSNQQQWKHPSPASSDQIIHAVGPDLSIHGQPSAGNNMNTYDAHQQVHMNHETGNHPWHPPHPYVAGQSPWGNHQQAPMCPCMHCSCHYRSMPHGYR